MAKKIIKLENFDYRNIVTLNQQVTAKRYLIFDLWNDCSREEKLSQRYNQIFLQINDLRVLNIKDGQIYFELTGREEVSSTMFLIEDHLMILLKQYLAKMNKKGNFNFCSVIKTTNTDSTALALNLKNDDYEITFYNRDKMKVDMSITNKKESTFNIIIEIMYIYFDMMKGVIVIDTRLRMMLESHIRPLRTRLTDSDIFIQDDKRNNTILTPSFTPTLTGIKKSFDITKTEVFEDDDVPIINQPIIKSQTINQAIKQSVQQPVQQPAQQPVQQPVQQPAHQSTNQPAYPSKQSVQTSQESQHINQTTSHHVHHPVHQPIHQPVHQPIHQPVQHSVYQTQTKKVSQMSLNEPTITHLPSSLIQETQEMIDKLEKESSISNNILQALTSTFNTVDTADTSDTINTTNAPNTANVTDYKQKYISHDEIKMINEDTSDEDMLDDDDIDSYIESATDIYDNDNDDIDIDDDNDDDIMKNLDTIYTHKNDKMPVDNESEDVIQGLIKKHKKNL